MNVEALPWKQEAKSYADSGNCNKWIASNIWEEGGEANKALATLQPAL